jgi:effector-binding domain-containing protein
MTLNAELRDVEARELAAVRKTTPRAKLGEAIIAGLDQVYAVLRARQATGLGHNVVVYRAARGLAPADTLDIEVGVQVSETFAPEGDVLALRSPSGRAVVATHVGPYQLIPATGVALRHWMTERGLGSPALDWEVYGDWNEDPARLSTEIYFLVREAAP